MRRPHFALVALFVAVTACVANKSNAGSQTTLTAFAGTWIHEGPVGAQFGNVLPDRFALQPVKLVFTPPKDLAVIFLPAGTVLQGQPRRKPAPNTWTVHEIYEDLGGGRLRITYNGSSYIKSYKIEENKLYLSPTPQFSSSSTMVFERQ